MKIIWNVLKISKIALIVVLIMLGFNACDKKETSLQKFQKEKDARDKYINDHNITTVPTYSGLYYIETLAGTGEKVTGGRIITVNYVGKFLDGNVFDSGTGFEFMVNIGNVIAGWDEAVLYMRDGGKATLIIPSDLAYGPYGNSAIPGYTTLVFDIEITNVQ